MTWLFVSTSPDEVSTIPVPAAFPPYASVVDTTTTPVFAVRWVEAGCREAPSASEELATRATAVRIPSIPSREVFTNLEVIGFLSRSRCLRLKETTRD
jgi:hypothetical protein